MRYVAATDVGRVRKVNEDCVLALPERRVWLVADGMGGHAAGDVASQMVADAVSVIPYGLGPAETMHAVRDAILRAHDGIRREAEGRGGASMGATVVALLLGENHFAAFWAGDSRLYRLRDGALEMLTTDHSLVAELVLNGEMGWDEAEQHPQSNVVTRAVGVGDALELDKVRGRIEPGDRFLLCSDGLTKYATAPILHRILASTPIDAVTGELMQVALGGGGADNISIIVVDVA